MNYYWPNGCTFAFTICDDTDNGTLENLTPIYEALVKAGLRTTKTVWSQPAVPGDRFTGQTLQDLEYRDWLMELVRAGFEIGWHGNRSGGSTRSEVERGLQIFRQVVGAWPRTYANHANNIENIYWGKERFDNRIIRGMFSLIRGDGAHFEGTLDGSEYNWADLCRERITYMRDFTFEDVVTTDVDPWMPYWDERRPAVKAWFSSTDAADADKFVRVLTKSALDRVEASGGACILYTHFASGFVSDGCVRRDVLEVLKDLSGRKGWYVPVSELLDHIVKIRGIHNLLPRERARLEIHWALEHLNMGAVVAWRRLTRNLSTNRHGD
jgi:hypothetical protein